MARSARLLGLVQALRCHRRPVTAAALGRELGVSTRTIYRDIETLVGEGAPIEGEAGVGYVLRPGFLLPPLMFEDEEIEALVLGLRFVVKRGDSALGRAAANAAAKVAAVLPADLREVAAATGLLAGPSTGVEPTVIDLAAIRQAIRAERKLRLSYADGRNRLSERTIWPIAIGFFDRARVLAAWCEARSAFRHFRVDRIRRADALPERYPRRRAVLLKSWREQEGIPEQL